MDNFSEELILAIGHRLQKPTLLASLQVCRNWNQILLPLIRNHMSADYWHHPSFPLRAETLTTIATEIGADTEKQAATTSLLDDPTLAAGLLDIHDLVWLYTSKGMNTQGKTVRKTSILTLDTLGCLVERMTNLVGLDLGVSSLGKGSMAILVGALDQLNTFEVAMG
ncbi:hypothetical protein BGZ95_000695 [Linnemannia exigua]|uniref:F-box domain-containing protein n=1 Tax=Linnemannia exigua TaxID=604196 RepID=A0AAD4H9X2_9FUNG|nr:hypothetical protein BGZ95_000695 [Linnemannia exigua]